MDMFNVLAQIKQRYLQQGSAINTEEATKTALVMPFIMALGYDIFNPAEVVPEYIADVGVKKGEKVDYMLIRDGKPAMLMECKPCGRDLSLEHASQLYRYFSVTDVRFGVLTNGLLYQFFSDLDKPNQMDSKPFFEFNILELEESTAVDIQKFSKSNFILDSILSNANELKYTKLVKKVLLKEFESPSESLVKILASNLYEGRFTSSVFSQFETIVKNAFVQIVKEKVDERLKSALNAVAEPVLSSDSSVNIESSIEEDSVVTTDEEREGFYIVRAILSSIVDPDRIVARDAQTYFAILLDDNNRKPICRLWLNAKSKRYLGVFDGSKNETKISIERITDIYKYSDKLINLVEAYEKI